MKKLVLLVVLGFGSAMPAQADDVSPWFGGEGSEPFQISSTTVQVSARETVPLIALPQDCELPDCPDKDKLAKDASSAEAP
jgi:hypothetical protein